MTIHTDPIDIPQATDDGHIAQNTHTSINDIINHGHRRTASFSNSSGSFPPSSLTSIPGSINAIRPPIVNEFSLNGWSFKSTRSSISSANQIEL